MQSHNLAIASSQHCFQRKSGQGSTMRVCCRTCLPPMPAQRCLSAIPVTTKLSARAKLEKKDSEHEQRTPRRVLCTAPSAPLPSAPLPPCSPPDRWLKRQATRQLAHEPGSLLACLTLQVPLLLAQPLDILDQVGALLRSKALADHNVTCGHYLSRSSTARNFVSNP